MAEATETDRTVADELLDRLFVQAPTGRRIEYIVGDKFRDELAQLRADAQEQAVFDFLNWLTAENMVIVHQGADYDGPSPIAEGELWEEWKEVRE